MWQIILQILAIIGIVLLVILGLVLLVAGLVLFVPIRYRLQADVDTTQQSYAGKGKVTWLLHILSVTADYPEPGKFTIKIFGYPWKAIELNKKEEADETPDALEDEGSTMSKPEGEGNMTPKPEKAEVEPGPENAISKVAKSINQQEADKKENAESSQTSEEEAREQKQEEKALKEEAKEPEAWYRKIIYTIRSLCDKIKEIWNTIKYYKDVLDEKQTRLLIDRSKKRIAKLLKAIAPKRIKGALRVGTGSPDTTGYLLAVYGMLVSYLDKHFVLEPDFEDAICKGQVSARGRIYLITVLIVVLSFACDKQVSILLRKLKREEQ